jgi:hypothetical protein
MKRKGGAGHVKVSSRDDRRLVARESSKAMRIGRWFQFAVRHGDHLVAPVMLVESAKSLPDEFGMRRVKGLKLAGELRAAITDGHHDALPVWNLSSEILQALKPTKKLGVIWPVVNRKGFT